MFDLAIKIPEAYPAQPPVLEFRSRVFHPNVHFKVRLVSPALAILVDWRPGSKDGRDLPGRA